MGKNEMSFTDRVMERIRNERIRLLDEKLIALNELPDLLEAASMEQGVFIEFYKSVGETYEIFHGKETTTLKVPQGFARIRVHSSRLSLDPFWNTFAALTEYKRPDLQS